MFPENLTLIVSEPTFSDALLPRYQSNDIDVSSISTAVLHFAKFIGFETICKETKNGHLDLFTSSGKCFLFYVFEETPLVDDTQMEDLEVASNTAEGSTLAVTEVSQLTIAEPSNEALIIEKSVAAVYPRGNDTPNRAYETEQLETLFRLVFIEGVSTKEASMQAGIKPSTGSGYISKAKRALGSLLEKPDKNGIETLDLGMMERIAKTATKPCARKGI